jgi:predicted NAD/FAD-dependent oxidoreductase
MKVLIIGAGIAGLTAARRLRESGWTVTILDKGRGPGGRLATRRIGVQRFDHGAQYIRAISPRFRQAIAEWREAGAVEEWFHVDGAPRYRGAGGMNAIAKHLAHGLDVRLGVKAELAEHDGGEWRVTAAAGQFFTAKVLLVTAPAPQALDLLGQAGAAVLPKVRQTGYSPCFALMLALEGPSGLPGPGFVRPASGPIAWAADNCVKGITEGGGALTIHATPSFTEAHFDTPQEEVAAKLIGAARPWTGQAGIREWQLHRWRYSLVTRPGPEPCCCAPTPGPLVLAGDAFGGPRVEGAFLSGYAAAQAIIEKY